MNSRRFIGSSSPLAPRAQSRGLKQRRYHGDTPRSTTLTHWRRKNLARRKNLHRRLRTRDAQFYWDQAHGGFSTSCTPRLQNNPDSVERGVVARRRRAIFGRPCRRAKRLYLVEFLAQWGDTKMAASRVLCRRAAD